MPTRLRAGVAVTPAHKPAAATLTLAGSMAFLAGATDVYGFLQLRGLYVSFMSGNTTMLGMSLSSGGFSRSAGIALLVGLFVVGAAAGQALLNVAGQFRAAAVLLAVSALLCMPLIVPDWMASVLVLAMGVLNAAMGKVGNASVSLTYVTGALVKFGQGLGNLLTGRYEDVSWLLQAPMWASLLAGGVTAATLQRFGAERPWILPVIGLLLATCAMWHRPDQPELAQHQNPRAAQTRP